MLRHVSTFFDALGKILHFWQKSKKADSLISYTQTTRVEPICIVDQRALYVNYTTDILQSLNSLFAGYYLQAAALSVNVGKIEVGKFLNHLNPDRPFLESLNDSVHNAALECLAGKVNLLPSAQDYRYGLPVNVRPGLESLPSGYGHALEAIDPELQKAMDEAKQFQEDVTGAIKQGYHKSAAQSNAAAAGRFHGAPRPYVHDPKLGEEENKLAKKNWDAAEMARTKTVSDQGFGTDLSKDMRESTNLSVGRMYTVNITDGGHSASIPVMIRLLTTECAPDLLVHILSDGAKVKSATAKERWFGFRLGELRLWNDLVLAQDLITEHKQALLADKNGVYQEILRRRRNNKVSGTYAAAKGGNPSVGTSSNLVVTTRQTIKDLEAIIGGKFDSFDVRQKVFERSYLMIVAVIDPDYDHVTFYYRGIALPTELTVRDLKKAGKEGSDVLEVLKTFQAGMAPKF